MLANAFFGSTVRFLAVGGYLLAECKPLIPYCSLILSECSYPIAIFANHFWDNLLAGFIVLGRRFSLKDTGKKLDYIEKQTRRRQSISD